MSDYNPVPANVQEAYDNFRTQVEESGFRITHMLIHGNHNTLKEGEDISMYDPNVGNIVVRYWPSIVVQSGDISVACMVTDPNPLNPKV